MTNDWTPPWLGVNDAAPPPASGKPAGARPRGPATADGGLKRRPSGGPRNGWQSPRWGNDAEFKESDHPRGESGQFSAGGGAAKKPHRREAATKRVMSDPLGWTHMKDADGNVWSYSERRHAWRASSKDMPDEPGGGWRDEPAQMKELGKRKRWIPKPKASDEEEVAEDWSSDWRPPGYDRLRKAKRAADDIALDSARSRALITARYLIRATSQAPRMAFDKALVTRALASQTVRMAFDQTSVRTFSPDGMMHVALSNISRASINPYLGSEIPDSEKMGLDPKRKYMLLRHPDELQKAAQTFNGLPILADHKPISADDLPQNLIVGTTGTDARYEHPMLMNSLHFWAKPAIDAIQNNTRRELSCAYHYIPLMKSGMYEGKPFDGIMTGIHGNHVALVESGRVGPAAIVADAMPHALRYASR